MKKQIKVMMVDDHQLVIDGFEASLSKFDIKVVKSLTSLENVREIYCKVSPDVLVLDVRFDGENKTGLDACEEIMAMTNDAKIVILSQFDHVYVVQKAYSVGALAFVKKDSEINTLVEAIKMARQGKKYFSPQMAQKLARLAVDNKEPLQVLSERELTIFKMVADGDNNNEIAEKVNLTPKTVGKIIFDIKEKLSIDRAAEFTKMAIKYQILELD